MKLLEPYRFFLSRYSSVCSSARVQVSVSSVLRRASSGRYCGRSIGWATTGFSKPREAGPKPPAGSRRSRTGASAFHVKMCYANVLT